MRKSIILLGLILTGCGTAYTEQNIHTASASTLCYYSVNGKNDPLVNSEIEKRKLDCAPILQNMAIQQQQQAARGNALLNYSMQMQQLELQRQAIYNANRPLTTSCVQQGIFTNCQSY